MQTRNSKLCVSSSWFCESTPACHLKLNSILLESSLTSESSVWEPCNATVFFCLVLVCFAKTHEEVESQTPEYPTTMSPNPPAKFQWTSHPNEVKDHTRVKKLHHTKKYWMPLGDTLFRHCKRPESVPAFTPKRGISISNLVVVGGGGCLVLIADRVTRKHSVPSCEGVPTTDLLVGVKRFLKA